MNAKKIIPAALIALAAAASSTAFAGQLGNEFTEMPQAQSTLTRAQVQAEVRDAQARGQLERTTYDELESVVLQRQAQNASTTTRAEVRAETRAYYKAHPNSEYERDTYGIGG